MTTLRAATAKDIDAIMEIERQPGFERLVGRSARSIHEELIVDPTHAYLLGLDEQAAIRGFGILRGICDANSGVYLKRIAVRGVGQGFGTALLHEIIDWVFTETATHRFWLDHIITNDRARHVYERCGLRREGVMREAYQMPDDGTRVDLAVMSILRREWNAG